MRKIWFLAMAVFLAACGKKENAPERTAAPAPPPPTAPHAADPRPAIVIFGDSLSAGFGLDPGQSFPDLLQKDFDARGLKYRIVNLGVSGDTTQDGLARLSFAVAEQPKFVVLELGANDGLRGIPTSVTQANLAQMIEAFQGAGAQVVLAGMTLPPNYGADFIKRFDSVYKDLASKYKVPLIPFLLAGVGGHQEFMQSDGLHPNAAGARKVAVIVRDALLPLVGR